MVFLFDIGRVLLDFDFEQSLKKLLPPGTPNAAQVIECILGRKDSLEAGSITPEDYTDWALNILQNNVSASQFRDAWCDIFTINQPMWQNIYELNALGHRLILISNISAIHCPWIFTAFPQFSNFEASILSFKVRALKPQVDIYQFAIRNYDLVPEETLYIDDSLENIQTGKQLGFKCWQYDINNHADFEQWLQDTLNTCGQNQE